MLRKRSTLVPLLPSSVREDLRDTAVLQASLLSRTDLDCAVLSLLTPLPMPPTIVTLPFVHYNLYPNCSYKLKTGSRAMLTRG